MKIVFFLSLLIFGSSAFAEGEKIKNACVDPQTFVEKIFNCDQNMVAVKFANLCAAQIRVNAKLAGKELEDSMSEVKTLVKGAQQNALVDAASRLDMALESLEEQIASMQKDTAIVATYSQVMIDFPDGNDDESSADCFNDAFHALQKLVNGLDDDIIKSKEAYKKAEELAASLDASSVDLSSLNQALASLPDDSPATPAPVVKKKGVRASDISGTEEKKKK